MQSGQVIAVLLGRFAGVTDRGRERDQTPADVACDQPVRLLERGRQLLALQHASTLVCERIGTISRQAVYDSLGALADNGLLRRIQPAGSAAQPNKILSPWQIVEFWIEENTGLIIKFVVTTLSQPVID